MRERTLAHRKMEDDVSDSEKSRRLARMIQVFHEGQLIKNKENIGKKEILLVEKESKKKGQFNGLTGIFF